MRDQYIRQNICVFSSLETEEGNFTDYLVDRNADVAQQITSEIFFKELFSDTNTIALRSFLMLSLLLFELYKFIPRG